MCAYVQCMDKELTEETSLLVMRVSSTLDKHLRKIMENSSKEDFEKMRSSIGFAMGYLYTDVLEPLWHQHPELRPEDMDGSYRIPQDVKNGF